MKEEIERRRAEAAEKRQKGEELLDGEGKTFKCLSPRGSSLKVQVSVAAAAAAAAAGRVAPGYAAVQLLPLPLQRLLRAPLPPLLALGHALQQRLLLLIPTSCSSSSTSSTSARSSEQADEIHTANS
ncbi:hypothetical protein CRUP_004636 [Coryphaenoides rupestris]|nr:hypothetical protein CRUP_004636 [Coryphaenoides rupestris]